jgi:hypothetical protein
MQNFQADLKVGLKLHYNLTIPENEAYNADFLKYAGIAQLVERNLAKVEVASSSLVSRSKHRKIDPVFQTKRKPRLPFLFSDRARSAHQLTMTNLPLTLREPIKA